MLKLNGRYELPLIDGPTAVVAPAEPRARRKRRPKAVTNAGAETTPKPQPSAVSHYQFNLTVALGVFIPVMSLATSKIAGTLAAHGHYALAAFGAGIGVAVLAVSLSHLAWAVRDVTGAGRAPVGRWRWRSTCPLCWGSWYTLLQVTRD